MMMGTFFARASIEWSQYDIDALSSCLDFRQMIRLASHTTILFAAGELYETERTERCVHYRD
jgi:hypothetical protein